jgi:quercetin dioxygenase-like cupin family protein
MSKKSVFLERDDRVGNEEDAVLYTDGAKAQIVSVAQVEGVPLNRAIETKILMPGPKASFFEQHFQQGLVVPPLRYAHDVMCCLVRGHMRVTLAGQSYEAVARDGWSAAPGVEVGLEALEDCVLVEWMSPPHLMTGNRLITWGTAPPCSSHIFSRWEDLEAMRMERVEGGMEFGPPGKDIRQFFKVLVPGPEVGVIWISHLEGKVANHRHYHHFLCYLMKGKMREKFGGTQENICLPGDIWATQAGAYHYTEALEDNELLEFKWPAPMLWNGIIHSWENRW